MLLEVLRSGTPNGDFMGLPTDGTKSFKIMTIDIHTIVDGKVHRSSSLGRLGNCHETIKIMKQLLIIISLFSLMLFLGCDMDKKEMPISDTEKINQNDKKNKMEKQSKATMDIAMKFMGAMGVKETWKP